MKCLWKLTALSALFTIALAAVASAQDDSLTQPSQAVTVNFSSNLIQDVPDPVDVAQDMDDAMTVDAVDVAKGGKGGGDVCDCPVRLFPETCHGIQIGGWINGGIYENGEGVSSGTGNLPVLFPQSSDGFQMDQMWIYAEKALPDDPCCHDWGFRIDYVFGTDGPDTQAFGDIGWDNGWNSSRDYGSAIPQLYVEYGNSDLSVKAGHFYTIIGYEVVPAPDNFFYSHAYAMLYAEPFTHTGVLVTKALNSQISVTGGWTMGWDSGFNNANDASTFLGSASWTSCDEKLSVTYAVTAGDFGDGDVENEGQIYMHSLVASYQINECLQYVLHHDYFDNEDDGEHEIARGINQYLFYTLSSCHKLGMRFEYFKDVEGDRVATNDPTYDGGEFYSITAGLNYTPNCNVIIRPEVRYDWFRGEGDPFGDGTEEEMFYYGMDFIVLF